MNKPAIPFLLALVCCASELAPREEDNINAGALMHPKPAHQIHVARYPDHTELYETSSTGGITAYVTPHTVQVTSLHLEQIQSSSENENERRGKKGTRENRLGVNVAKAGAVLPQDRERRERVVRGMGETVGASEEFGRALEGIALSKNQGTIIGTGRTAEGGVAGGYGEASKTKYSRNETARKDGSKKDVGGVKDTERKPTVAGTRHAPTATSVKAGAEPVGGKQKELDIIEESAKGEISETPIVETAAPGRGGEWGLDDPWPEWMGESLIHEML